MFLRHSCIKVASFDEGGDEGHVLFNDTHFIFGYMASDMW